MNLDCTPTATILFLELSLAPPNTEGGITGETLPYVFSDAKTKAKPFPDLVKEGA